VNNCELQKYETFTGYSYLFFQQIVDNFFIVDQQKSGIDFSFY